VALELYEVVSVRVVVECEDVDGSDIEDDSGVVFGNLRWGGGGFCWWFVVCDGGGCSDGGNGLGGIHSVDKWHERVIVVLGVVSNGVNR